MRPRFLIFPCVLTDEQFEIIAKVRNSLNECHLELTTMCMLNPQVKYLKVDCIVNDLSEVLKNKIEKGWRYNSYVLNLAIVKLDYAITIVNLDLNNSESKLAILLQHCYEVTAQILCNSYSEYASSEF